MDYGEEIDLIGFHGQTIFHNPEKNFETIRGRKEVISNYKKIVVNNFREQDLFNGGQGFPLTPIYHSLLVNIVNKKDLDYPINIINIGGITNITQVMGKFDQQGKI